MKWSEVRSLFFYWNSDHNVFYSCTARNLLIYISYAKWNKIEEISLCCLKLVNNTFELKFDTLLAYHNLLAHVETSQLHSIILILSFALSFNEFDTKKENISFNFFICLNCQFFWISFLKNKLKILWIKYFYLSYCWKILNFLTVNTKFPVLSKTSCWNWTAFNLNFFKLLTQKESVNLCHIDNILVANRSKETLIVIEKVMIENFAISQECVVGLRGWVNNVSF